METFHLQLSHFFDSLECMSNEFVKKEVWEVEEGGKERGRNNPGSFTRYFPEIFTLLVSFNLLTDSVRELLFL